MCKLKDEPSVYGRVSKPPTAPIVYITSAQVVSNTAAMIATMPEADRLAAILNFVRPLVETDEDDRFGLEGYMTSDDEYVYPAKRPKQTKPTNPNQLHICYS